LEKDGLRNLDAWEVRSVLSWANNGNIGKIAWYRWLKRCGRYDGKAGIEKQGLTIPRSVHSRQGWKNAEVF
jgi:hypothetical protein